jgi:hypothetical protein
LAPRVLSTILLLLLAACAGGPAGGPDLALYCQVKACVCRPAGRIKPAPAAVLWRANGDAYCPADHRLTPIEGKDGFKRRYGG